MDLQGHGHLKKLDLGFALHFQIGLTSNRHLSWLKKWEITLLKTMILKWNFTRLTYLFSNILKDFAQWIKRTPSQSYITQNQLFSEFRNFQRFSHCMHIGLYISLIICICIISKKWNAIGRAIHNFDYSTWNDQKRNWTAVENEPRFKYDVIRYRVSETLRKRMCEFGDR